MSSVTEGRHAGDFLLSMANGKRSFDTVTVTVPGSTTWGPGKVLGQHAGTGKYLEYDNAGSDGTETASGILYSELANADVSAADFTGVIVNMDAEVRLADLTWASGASQGDKDAGVADLKALGIKARS